MKPEEVAKLPIQQQMEYWKKVFLAKLATAPKPPKQLSLI
jgi:hypothetical protein